MRLDGERRTGMRPTSPAWHLTTCQVQCPHSFFGSSAGFFFEGTEVGFKLFISKFDVIETLFAVIIQSECRSVREPRTDETCGSCVRLDAQGVSSLFNGARVILFFFSATAFSFTTVLSLGIPLNDHTPLTNALRTSISSKRQTVCGLSARHLVQLSSKVLCCCMANVSTSGCH